MCSDQRSESFCDAADATVSFPVATHYFALCFAFAVGFTIASFLSELPLFLCVLKSSVVPIGFVGLSTCNFGRSQIVYTH